MHLRRSLPQLELWDGKPGESALLPGYGWIFALGDGTVNVGLGSVSSTAAATKIDYKTLFGKWMENAPTEWEFTRENQLGPVRGAALPMGFNRKPLYARGLSTGFNETPHRASRPYDRDRDGFVMGGGAGILVIEEREHALARGAKPLAEIVGYGATADAHHMTAGPDDGEGARRAMQIALRQAHLAPSDIQHLNAHATSTPLGDVGELAAMKAVFGPDATVAISATKSATGHLLGAAGGLEAIFTVIALRDQIAPPTLNLDNPDAAADGLDLVGPQARAMTMEHAISNSFGFGGVNASIIFCRPD